MSWLNFLFSLIGNYVNSDWYESFFPYALAMLVICGFIALIRYVTNLHRRF